MQGKTTIQQLKEVVMEEKKRFYDIHCHTTSLSHPCFYAFMRRFNYLIPLAGRAMEQNMIISPKFNIKTFHLIAGYLLMIFFLMSAGEIFGFEYYEHKFISDVAYYCAIKKLDSETANNLNLLFKINNMRLKKRNEFKCEHQVLNKFQNVNCPKQILDDFFKGYNFSFGDMAAMGDHYEAPSQLGQMLNNLNSPRGKNDNKFDAIMTAAINQHKHVGKWYRKIKSNDSLPQKNTHDFYKRIPDCYKPSPKEESLFANVPDYISLASKNCKHFSEAAWNEWQIYHDNAKSIAQELNKLLPSENFEKYKAKIIEMLCNEAYAQHFLADAFASGHMVTKRCWADRCPLFFPMAFSEYKHDYYNENGIPCSVHCEEKYFYGDKCLLTPDAEDQLQIVLSIASDSMEEVLTTAFGNGVSDSYHNFFWDKPLLMGPSEENLPPYKWEGIIFSMIHLSDPNDLKYIRIDFGYGYGKNIIEFLPFNYVGADIYISSYRNESFHFLDLGSVSFLSDEFYWDPNRIDSYLGVLCADQLFHGIFRGFRDIVGSAGEPLRILKLDSKNAFGINYYGYDDVTDSEDQDTDVQFEYVYSFSMSANVFRNFSFKMTTEIMRSTFYEGNFKYEWFRSYGGGIEYTF
jgi:hypothetical protein